MRSCYYVCLVGLVLLIGTVAFSDSIQLTLQKGPGAGQVTLGWSGAPAPYEVYRSASPADVVAPGHLIAVPVDPTYIDTPPDVPLLFYVVTQAAAATCGN